jgi:hypothetical protein
LIGMDPPFVKFRTLGRFRTFSSTDVLQDYRYIQHEGAGFSGYGDSDIALMRQQRAQGASFDEIARE